MRKVSKLFCSNTFLIFILIISSLITIKSSIIHEINEDIPGTSDYKQVSFESDGSTLNHFFKYTLPSQDNIPTSRIGAFRIDFDAFNDLSLQNLVFCTFVDESTTDEDLEEQLRQLTSENSACVGEFDIKGIYDGIIEYDPKKTKLGIYLVAKGFIQFTATVKLRITETFLTAKAEEQHVSDEETHSLIPYSIVISDFREYGSRILFYSSNRELQMYYTELDTTYPEKLFSGNIMSVYTNPNMVHQKYHDANVMVLLTRGFKQESEKKFQFQVLLFQSNYLLDYYVSNDQNGRSKNSPLSINMTECGSPYYIILNYNKPEKKINLYIDEIYGKIQSLSVATKLKSSTWQEMIENDMDYIQASTRNYELPKDSKSHMDIYKLECKIPLLLNFYYVDESATVPDLNYGSVAITTLKALKTVSFPFASGIFLPELTIEVFNPIKLPLVIVNDGQNENLINKNTLIKSMPFTTSKPIIVKERNGDSNTIVIIKVGYNVGSWEDHSSNVKYNSQLNMYVFSFPNDDTRLNYKYANVITKGLKETDNIKYCYATNIGSAILPSAENCYRVSLNSIWILKVLNPFIMHKDYDLEDGLSYYVSIKPVVETEKISVEAELETYDTDNRNIEGIASKIEIDSSGKASTILTAPKNKDVSEFLQIQQCSTNSIKMKVLNAYDNSEVVSETTIDDSSKNFYKIFNNILLETELQLTGNSNTNVFVKHAGIRSGYYPSLKDDPTITFNSELNQLIIESPINNYERMKYIVLISKENELSKKGLTLCSFVDKSETSLYYNKTIESHTEKTTVSINFNKVGLTAGQKFEALVFSEQQINSKMAFLSKVFTGTVGQIDSESFTEIKTTYDIDNDYVYARDTASTDDLTYYFTYLPETTFDVPVGAFRIELDTDAINGFSGVDCAFVDENEDPLGMVEAVEDIIDSRKPYCIGGKSTTSGRIYNYIFRYSYTSDNKPRKLVIKISNGQSASGGFTVYVRKGDNTYIENTNFIDQKEYGRQEEYKKSVMPYIVDLRRIRGESETDYVSKALFYSQHLEMQMYYIDETGEVNAPILLFTGNIMLVYTKLTLAQQKYHSTKLILLSENIMGQEHSSLGNQFRFHTKMYKSEDQIEYFVSNNPTGRTLNYPLSLEVNTCTSENNKYLYILNYNKPEDERILYLDLIFGSLKNARYINEINADKWDSLITNNMIDIINYTAKLQRRSQHIDIVLLDCNTPLLANAYYGVEGQEFSGLELGDIAIENLNAKSSTSIGLVADSTSKLYYSISVFNPVENPDISVKLGSAIHQINQNSLVVGVLLFGIPESVSVVNNGDSATRFIFKIGYGVDESDWSKDQDNIDGMLYSKGNKYIYRFPAGDKKKNFTDVLINVKAMKQGSQQESENIKFCYSSSMGMPIDVSLENCFRTGVNIPYSMTFLNPLISTKNYKSYSDFYYVTLSPYYSSEYISLGINEHKYDTKERNIEGVGNIVYLEDKTEKSTILSIPEVTTNKNILLQLQLCSSTSSEINYKLLNAYNKEELISNTLSKQDKLYLYQVSNYLMEAELKFIGHQNDVIFAKHIGVTNYEIHTQELKVTFDETQNVVNINKPILNQAFRITILVGEKGRFDTYSLCTFAEKKESEYKDLADYVNIFTSVNSNIITHYINFRSFNYEVGHEFDLLVYAVQENNEKLEVLYDVITAKVGKVQAVVGIEGNIPGKNDYKTQLFIKNTTSNYLYYNFGRHPVGYVASLKIKQESEVEEGMRITKVGCTFVDPNASDEDMVYSVNNAMSQGKSVCIGESQKDNNGFDALISANDLKSGSGNSRLVIQVMYGLGEEEENKKLKDESVTLNITLRINGVKVDTQDYGYNVDEKLTLVPYVLDLKEIRGNDEENYVSKVLLFSNTRELQMFYLANSGAPVELFSGNIMLVYTNPDVINEKYFGASTMILITDSLSSTSKTYIGEKFRFKANFFDSKTTIQYYVSANPSGRLLNNPTSIEMLSCDQPYYFILNYNYYESDRILHIDNIFGEVDTQKIATQLTDNNWYDFVNNMEPFEGTEYFIKEQSKYHIDVLQVTCKIPLLLNIYYTDPISPKKTNLDEGDISIISLYPGTRDTLTFKLGLEGEFIYSFTVYKESNENPNIRVDFEGEDTLDITKNGIITKRSTNNYYLITIINNEYTGSEKTKIIFKFGYAIDKTFTKIKNDVYNLQTDTRPANLFGYIFKNGEDRLNYTKVDFEVSTTYENVKFCYSSNLGAYIDPSLQNCFRVGRTNSYTISVLNPYVMSKNYYTSEEVMDYYVSFRTEDINLNITITPNLFKYTTNNRNTEGYPSSLTIKNDGISTILTAPANLNKYIFIQMHVCTSDKSVGYEIRNAYNDSVISKSDAIPANTENYYRNVENTKLDTSLVFEDLTPNSVTPKVFIKHVGIDEEYKPTISQLTVKYHESSNTLTFQRPIEDEEFKYTVYLDKKGNLKNQNYTLCSFAEISKLAHYAESFTSKDENLTVTIDFEKGELKGYESFDVLVLAEQVDKGEIMILSNLVQGQKGSSEPEPDNKKKNNTVLIIVLVVLALLLVAGGIFLFICLRRLKNKPMENVIIAKPTNLDDIQGTNKGEKMIDSMAQSQAYENQN